MRLKVAILSKNPQHIHFSIFMNGANCGRMCMYHKEAAAFIGALQHGADMVNLRMEVTEHESKLPSNINAS